MVVVQIKLYHSYFPIQSFCRNLLKTEVCGLRPVGEQFLGLCFHFPPPLKLLLISPQARISLLLLLFHLLIYDRPLFPCCGPTCHVKNSLHRKKVSTGNSGLRTSSPAEPRHMLTHSAPLVEANILLLQSHSPFARKPACSHTHARKENTTC